ncbi:tetratricopeptide repeat protein [Marivita sp.]|uniref:tetratricopeptide repeat protein n=1 Tax=Marivita sp. TaxID=2003365 RepID=UPI0025C43F16|nr:tetratricopeptide repeat protein [Marivita sp.]
MRMILSALALCSAQAAAAEGCPEAPDHSAALDTLYAEVQGAPNEMVARGFSNQMWELWLDAPDEPSQMMLDAAQRAMRVGDYLRAQDRLNALVSYCPFYAEGYNQRALLNYLRGDYPAVLPDLDQAIALSPRHTGALTGKALTLIALGRDAEAQVVLKDAVALNPWLSERALITPPQGDDI